MILLRTLTDADVALIQRWPPYPPAFDELDYALREHGWLTEFRNQPNTQCYLVSDDGDAIAFALLAKTANQEAEFRVALHADKIGRGYGEMITRTVLTYGFSKLNLRRIHLIVRKTNPRAQRLYQKIGFVTHGECVKEIHGQPVEFIEMDIERAHYRAMQQEKS
jgi:diamine N-acetyltransferase